MLLDLSTVPLPSTYYIARDSHSFKPLTTVRHSILIRDIIQSISKFYQKKKKKMTTLAKRISTSQWDTHKEIILSLNRSYTLKDLVQLMSIEHGFVAT